MTSRKKARNRVNATGRNEAARFVMLNHWMLDCDAFSRLRPMARALLLELARRYNGVNNGMIGLGEREAVARLAIADRKAVRRAFAELEGAGFIAKTRAGGFNVKSPDARRASEWRLTWLPTADALPTKDFMVAPRDPGPLVPRQVS